MNKHRRFYKHAGWFVLVQLVCVTFALGQNIAEYSAEYTASANGLTARASRTLHRISEGNYQLNSTIIASIAGTELAKLTEVSNFVIEGSETQPNTYEYDLSGAAMSNRRKSIMFSWPNNKAVSSEGLESWTLELNDKVQDPLSYQVSLSLAAKHAQSESFEFLVVDKNAIKQQSFLRAEDAIIDTPIGQLETVKIMKLRENDPENSTAFWLAKEYEFLLVRLEQSNDNLTIVLEIERAEINGTLIKP